MLEVERNFSKYESTEPAVHRGSLRSTEMRSLGGGIEEHAPIRRKDIIAKIYLIAPSVQPQRA
jgi:hypothetical protein